MTTNSFFFIIACSFLIWMKNISNKCCGGNQNTYFVPSNSFFENRTVYDMWKNSVERGRPQMTIWRTRIACWIPKATKTLRTCNTYCLHTTPMVALTRLNVTLNVYCLYFVYQVASVTKPFIGFSWSSFRKAAGQFVGTVKIRSIIVLV